MTDSPAPLSDEELSSALDDEASPDLARRIDGDDAARARQAELAAAAAFVADHPPSPLDQPSIDALIAAAVDTPVAPLSTGRSAPPRWLVAAVILVLMGIGLTLVWNGSRTSTAARFNTVGKSISAESASADSGAGGSLATDDSEAPDTDTLTGGGHAATTVAPQVGRSDATALPATYLGAYDTPAALRTAVAKLAPPWSKGADPTASYDTGAAARRPAPSSVQRCADQLKTTLSLDAGPVEQGYATVDGKSVLVYGFDHASYADGSPSTLIAAVGVAACDQVVLFET